MFASGFRLPYHPSMAVDQAFEHEISEFLRQDSTVDAMVDASKRGRPAVEVIDTELLRRFGDRVRPAIARQRIGRLVRPIMESRGWMPTRRQRTGSRLFTSGTVYGQPMLDHGGHWRFLREDPPLSDSIMTMLGKHDIDVPAPDISRAVDAAIATVVVNRRHALPFTSLLWHPHAVAISRGSDAGHLRILVITVDAALSRAADRRHAALPDSQLKPHQLEQLRVGLAAMERTASSIDARVRTAFKYGAMCATGITKERAARRLRRDRARVDAWVRSGELYSLPIGGGVRPRLPLFQFDDDVADLVPHVTEVFPELDPDLHPVGVFNWFTSPNPGLASPSTEFEPISPRNWLLRKYPPEPVYRLAAAVSAGSPA